MTVEDLFYHIMRGLADKTLTMDTPVIMEYNGAYKKYFQTEVETIRNNLVIKNE